LKTRWARGRPASHNVAVRHPSVSPCMHLRQTWQPLGVRRAPTWIRVKEPGVGAAGFIVAVRPAPWANCVSPTPRDGLQLPKPCHPCFCFKFMPEWEELKFEHKCMRRYETFYMLLRMSKVIMLMQVSQCLWNFIDRIAWPCAYCSFGYDNMWS
jgi:hypothetical protein